MKKLLSVWGLAILLVACTKDNRERLFEMAYPGIDFEIPAGLSNSLPRVFERDNQPTNIQEFVRQTGIDTAVISGIIPQTARITSLDNLDYDFVEEVSVRVCPAGSAQCTMAEEVFYIDNLQGRAGRTIELLPSLGNAKRVLTKKSYRLEVVFFFRYTTPYTMRSRLDMTFEAVR